MTDMTDELDGAFSLADLADLDVSDIDEVRYVSIPAGVFDWEVIRGDLTEDEKDGERRFKAEFELKILEAKAILEPGHNPEDFVGKLLTERFFVKPTDEPAKVQAAIGRIRAFISDIGQESAGKLGEIVANTVGHSFTGKVIKQKDRQDPSITYARLRLDQAKK